MDSAIIEHFRGRQVRGSGKVYCCSLSSRFGTEICRWLSIEDERVPAVVTVDAQGVCRAQKGLGSRPLSELPYRFFVYAFDECGVFYYREMLVPPRVESPKPIRRILDL